MFNNQHTTTRSNTVTQMNIQTYLRPIVVAIALLSFLWTGNLASAQTSDDSCIVSTDTSNQVRVRVGPGEHRTAVTYLEVDTDYTVLGRYESNDGDIWYQLDKEEAAPNRAINEAWINAADVDTDGDCDELAESSAPPVIPIVNQTASTTSSTETSADAETVTEDGRIIISEGRWLVSYAAITNASCEDIDNVEFTTYEWFGFNPGFTAELVLTETGFRHGGVDFTYIGDNTYHGSFSDGILTGTVYLTATAPDVMVGRYIDSANGCSATTNISLTLQ